MGVYLQFKASLGRHGGDAHAAARSLSEAAIQLFDTVLCKLGDYMTPCCSPKWTCTLHPEPLDAVWVCDFVFAAREWLVMLHSHEVRTHIPCVRFFNAMAVNKV
jgi:hypothetical protein